MALVRASMPSVRDGRCWWSDSSCRIACYGFDAIAGGVPVSFFCYKLGVRSEEIKTAARMMLVLALGQQDELLEREIALR